jgi:hypothetical protein
LRTSLCWFKKFGVQNCKQVTWHAKNSMTQENGAKVNRHSAEKCLIINKTPTRTMCNDPGHRCDLTTTECPPPPPPKKEQASTYWVQVKSCSLQKHNTLGKWIFKPTK